MASFNASFTRTTNSPSAGPKKKPAKRAGSSAISKSRKDGVKGSGKRMSISTKESAPKRPMKIIVRTSNVLVFLYGFICPLSAVSAALKAAFLFYII